MKRKWIALGLAAILLLSISGCSCAGKTATEKEQPTVTQEPTSSTNAPAATAAPATEATQTAGPTEKPAGAGAPVVTPLETAAATQTPPTAEPCEHVMEETVIAPTCTEYGYTQHRCVKCGMIIMDERTEPTGHTLRLVDMKNATCTEDGKVEYCCDVCGQVLTGTIAASGHHPVADPEVPATCQRTGLTAGSHCDLCGEVLKAQETIPLAEHRYENDRCIWCGKSKSDGGGNELPEIPG